MGRSFSRRINFLLVFFSFLFSFLTAEIFLHAFPPSFSPPRVYVGEQKNRVHTKFVYDDLIGWKMGPLVQFQWNIDGEWSSYQSNAQGFRSSFDFNRNDKRKKVALVGDSFTFGTGVNFKETYGALIDNQLSNGVVFNLAMPGFGVDQMWMALRHQGLPLKPDLIIVAFVDVDFDRSLTAYRFKEGFNKPRFKLSNGKISPMIKEDIPNFLLRGFYRHSLVWRSLEKFSRWLSFNVGFGEWWDLNEKIFTEIREESHRNRVPLLFVRIPMKGWQKFDILRQYMERVDVNYLDLTDFRRITPESIHFEHDSHINIAGHQFVAEGILAWIRTNLPNLSSEHSNTLLKFETQK